MTISGAKFYSPGMQFVSDMVRTCPNCGNNVDRSMDFCIECGDTLGRTSVETGGTASVWLEGPQDGVVASYREVLEDGMAAASRASDETISVAIDRITSVAQSYVPALVPGYIVDTADGLVRALSIAEPARLDPHVGQLLDALTTPEPAGREPRYCDACYRTFRTDASGIKDDACEFCGATLTESGRRTCMPTCWCGANNPFNEGHHGIGVGEAGYQNSIAVHVTHLAGADDEIGIALVDRLDSTEPTGPLLEAVARTALANPECFESGYGRLQEIAFQTDTDESTVSLAKCALLALVIAADDPRPVAGEHVVTDRIIQAEATPEDEGLALAASGMTPSRPAVRTRISEHTGSQRTGAASLLEELYGSDVPRTSDLGSQVREKHFLVGPILERLMNETLVSDRDLIAAMRPIAAHNPSLVEFGEKLLTERLSECPGDFDAFVTLSYLATIVEEPGVLAPSMISHVAQIPEETRFGASSEESRCEALARYLSSLGLDTDKTDEIGQGLKLLGDADDTDTTIIRDPPNLT